jgi:hypothetical protein
MLSKLQRLTMTMNQPIESQWRLESANPTPEPLHFAGQMTLCWKLLSWRTPFDMD